VPRSSSIRKTGGVCAGAAHLAGTYIPVWQLVQARGLGVDEASLLGWFPELGPEHLAAAWAYYEAHRDEIDRAIHLQEHRLLR
jgi:uncharacterized protein (DUF433 family)